MPQSLYARTAARGFPVFDVSGQSGAGHLPSYDYLPQHAGLPDATWTDPEHDPAAVPAVLAAPEEYVLGLSLWGLPSAPNPDNTPKGVEYPGRTPGDVGPGGPQPSLIPREPNDDPVPQGSYHDAPLIDPPTDEPGRWRAYIQADDAFRGENFTFTEINNPGADGSLVGFQGRMKQDHVGPVVSTDEVLQERATGQLRGNAGLDAVQGYGGGGPGPGGVNEPELTYDQRNYPGKFYAADGFTQAGEVPHLDAETAQFILNQPGMAPWTGDMWSFPLTATHAQAIVAADVPLQGPSVGAGSGVQPLWGG